MTTREASSFGYIPAASLAAIYPIISDTDLDHLQDIPYPQSPWWLLACAISVRGTPNLVKITISSLDCMFLRETFGLRKRKSLMSYAQMWPALRSLPTHDPARTPDDDLFIFMQREEVRYSTFAEIINSCIGEVDQGRLRLIYAQSRGCVHTCPRPEHRSLCRLLRFFAACAMIMVLLALIIAAYVYRNPEERLSNQVVVCVGVALYICNISAVFLMLSAPVTRGWTWRRTTKTIEPLQFLVGPEDVVDCALLMFLSETSSTNIRVLDGHPVRVSRKHLKESAQSVPMYLDAPTVEVVVSLIALTVHLTLVVVLPIMLSAFALASYVLTTQDRAIDLTNASKVMLSIGALLWAPGHILRVKKLRKCRECID